MAAPRIRVALPWLQGALAEATGNDELPKMAALRWLGGRGRLQAGEPRPWREWLLEPVDGANLLARWPAGPALATQSGLSASGPGTWCVAQPVHLAAGLDHLRLAPLHQAAPAAAEALELGALVSSHFASDDLTVVAFVDGAWLLRFSRTIDCVTQPPESVVGRDVHDFMPAGPDGAYVRSLMNEIQMLLHEHPVNQRRERARQPTVNGWWLWGFGAIADHMIAADFGPWQLRSDDGWLRALWHGHGRVAADGASVGSETVRVDTLLSLAQPATERVDEALAAIDAGVLSVLATHLRQGTLQSLDLLAGSVTLHVDSRARWQFWRRPVEVSRWLA